MAITFAIENAEGQYFTQWRFETLKQLAEELNERAPVENARLHYDQNEDFHYLKCEANKHDISVRFYKVFTAFINGVEHWRGCPEGSVSKLARSISNAVREPKT